LGGYVLLYARSITLTAFFIKMEADQNNQDQGAVFMHAFKPVETDNL
jgi:hypothetical protein